MAKQICGALASCVAVSLALTLAGLPEASATRQQHQHSKTHAVKRTAKQRTKAKRKSVRRRQTVSYLCPMHPDIRSNSRGTCPKCLMELVAERRDAKKR